MPYRTGLTRTTALGPLIERVFNACIVRNADGQSVTANPSLQKWKGRGLARNKDRVVSRQHLRVYLEASVFGSSPHDAHRHSDFQRLAGESPFGQFARTRKFTRPGASLPRVGVLDSHKKIRMRVHPIDVGDHTAQSDRFPGVELRKNGVMRCRQYRRREKKNEWRKKNQRLHGTRPMMLPPAGCRQKRNSEHRVEV